MDFGKSFGYVFEDPQWVNKILIGSLLVLVSLLFSPILIGLLGFAVLSGYALEVLRNVRQGSARPLPEWRDRWGEWLVLGLKLWLVTLVWSLPGILLTIPNAMISWLVEQGGSGAQALGSMLLLCVNCLSFIWWIVVALVSPAVYIRLAETETVSSGLEFKEIYQFTRDHIGDVIIAVILVLVVTTVLLTAGSIVGTLLCLVGLLLTLPAAILLSTLIEAHLYAQIGRSTARQRSGAIVPSPAAPPAPQWEADVPTADVMAGVADEVEGLGQTLAGAAQDTAAAVEDVSAGVQDAAGQALTDAGEAAAGLAEDAKDAADKLGPS